MSASAGPKFEIKCKVCKSKFRNTIENLHVQGMSPEKIYKYLQGLEAPSDKVLVGQEDINPSSIRRHIAKHFDVKDGVVIKVAESQAKVELSRSVYSQGVSIVVDKVNTVSHLIEVAMANIEDAESKFGSEKLRHTLTIQYMNTIKGLIESLAKLTGDLKQEGNIDVNFFNNEITIFAEIVLSTMRKIDKELNLNGALETIFAQEFKTQWDAYKLRQQRILNGDLSPMEGQKDMNINTFNVVDIDDDF